MNMFPYFTKGIGGHGGGGLEGGILFQGRRVFFLAIWGRGPEKLFSSY